MPTAGCAQNFDCPFQRLPVKNLANLDLTRFDFMRTARATTFLAACLAVWLGFGPAPASAQLFGRKREPMRRPGELLHRQEGPKVAKDLEPLISASNSRVVISLSKQRAWVMAGENIYIDTPISSGKRVGMTPTGSFHVLEKDPDHHSSIYGDFVDRQGRTVRAGVSMKVDSAPSGTRYVGASMRWFMRLTDGGVGMHVGILPGYAASHGCIRLPSDIAKLIYDKVKPGTPVTIEP